MLEKLCEENTNITKITTWSDSCVPQNRNSYMAAAILHFLSTHNNIECVEMKYSVPGHSCIQEVDNVHSQLEKCFSIAEFHSPLSLMRLVLKANRKKPFVVIQMHPVDVKDFKRCGDLLNFKTVPFSKLVSMKLTYSTVLSYRLTYGPTAEVHHAELLPPRGLRNERTVPLNIPAPKTSKMQPLPAAKKIDLKTMLKFMPHDDKAYMTSLINL